MDHLAEASLSFLLVGHIIISHMSSYIFTIVMCACLLVDVWGMTRGIGCCMDNQLFSGSMVSRLCRLQWDEVFVLFIEYIWHQVDGF